jgi:hypothetical protein
MSARFSLQVIGHSMSSDERRQSTWSRQDKIALASTIIAVIAIGVSAWQAEDEPRVVPVRREDIQLILSVEQKYAQLDESEQDDVDEYQYRVHYDLTKGGTRSLPVAHIKYASEYFQLLDGDGLIKRTGILGDGPYFFLPQVGIDIKILNDSELPVFIHEAVVEVVRSRENLQPLMMFVHGFQVTRAVAFVNEGWAEPIDMVFEARLINRATGEATKTYMLKAGDSSSEQYYAFSIMPILQDLCEPSTPFDAAEALEDTASFEVTAAVWSRIYASCDRLRPFALSYEPPGHDGWGDGEIIVALNGTLRWAERDAEGRSRNHTLNAATEVQITPAKELGAAGFPPTGDYDVKLRTTGSAYTIPIRISQPIPPRGFDRFVLWIGADHSSVHDFVVRLRYNEDGEIRTTPIKLEYLMPRSNLKSVVTNRSERN